MASATEVSPARRAAYAVLRRTFEHDAWADRALEAAAERMRLDARERAHAKRLAYGAVQRRRTADHLVAKLSRRAAGELEAPLIAALRLGLYELVFATATPDYAAVDQAVELAKGGLSASGARAGRARAAAGLVNAVLRRAVDEAPRLIAKIDDATADGVALAHSYPDWIARLWWRELGADDARSLMAAMNEPAETAFRINTLRADPEELAVKLRAAGEVVDVPAPGPGPLSPPEAIVVEGAIGERVRAAIGAMELIGQSRGSQAVVELLDPQPGERVLDLCAAPGRKTTQIAARLRGRGKIDAFETDAGRARQLRELCASAGAPGVTVRLADAAEADLGSGYDRVLVDPPCSDLGTLASRPDARWRKSPDVVERLAALQRRILARAAAALGPGGTLVYSTCTVSVDENEAVASAPPGVTLDDLGALYPGLASHRDSRFLQVRPDRHRTTGFFIARMRRER